LPLQILQLLLYPPYPLTGLGHCLVTGAGDGIASGRSFDRYEARVKYGGDFSSSSAGELDAAFGSGERFSCTLGED
jgi:hypothetical protein